MWIVVQTRCSRCESSNLRTDSKCALDQLRAASPASAKANLMYTFMNEAVGLGKKKIVMQVQNSELLVHEVYTMYTQTKLRSEHAFIYVVLFNSC